MKRVTSSLLAILLLSLLTAAQTANHQLSPDEIEIQVSPQTILLSWKAKGDVRVTVHADVDYSTVETLSVQLGGFDALYTFADARGDLVAKFIYEEIRSLVEVGYSTLTLTGTRNDGTTFTGEDVVRVVG
jgi:hypothetical protein